MKYLLKIEGGFTGIPQEYRGNLPLSNVEAELFKKSMKIIPTENRQLRDGLIYTIKLMEANETYTAVFDEHNLPKVLRKFIVSIKTKSL